MGVGLLQLNIVVIHEKKKKLKLYTKIESQKVKLGKGVISGCCP